MYLADFFLQCDQLRRGTHDCLGFALFKPRLHQTPSDVTQLRTTSARTLHSRRIRHRRPHQPGAGLREWRLQTARPRTGESNETRIVCSCCSNECMVSFQIELVSSLAALKTFVSLENLPLDFNSDSLLKNHHNFIDFLKVQWHILTHEHVVHYILYRSTPQTAGFERWQNSTSQVGRAV